MDKHLAEMREECIMWYIERRNDRATAEIIVKNTPKEIRRIYQYMLDTKEKLS